MSGLPRYVTYNWKKFVQGSSWSASVFWLDDNQNPKNLTGYTARMQLRPAPESSLVLVELSTTNGKITINISTAEIAMVMTGTDTQALTPPGCVYDLELTSPSSQVIKLMTGKFEIEARVSR